MSRYADDFARFLAENNQEEMHNQSGTEGGQAPVDPLDNAYRRAMAKKTEMAREKNPADGRPGNMGRSFGIGLNQLKDQFGYVAENVGRVLEPFKTLHPGIAGIAEGTSRSGPAIQESAQDRQFELEAQMTPEYQASRQKKWTSNEGDGGLKKIIKQVAASSPALGSLIHSIGDESLPTDFGDAWQDPDAYLDTIIASAPHMIAGIASGHRITKGLLPLVKNHTVAAVLGFGAGEGGVAGSATGKEVVDAVREASFAELAKMEPFQRAYHSTDENMPHEERLALARTKTEWAAFLEFGGKAGSATAFLGSPSSIAMGRLFRGIGLARKAQKPGWLDVPKYAAVEGVTEVPQESSEEYFGAAGEKKHVDPTINPFKNMAEAGTAGGVAGFFTGLVLGGGSQISGRRQYAKVRKMITEIESEIFNPDGTVNPNADVDTIGTYLGLTGLSMEKWGEAGLPVVSNYLLEKDAIPENIADSPDFLFEADQTPAEVAKPVSGLGNIGGKVEQQQQTQMPLEKIEERMAQLEAESDANGSISPAQRAEYEQLSQQQMAMLAPEGQPQQEETNDLSEMSGTGLEAEPALQEVRPQGSVEQGENANGVFLEVTEPGVGTKRFQHSNSGVYQRSTFESGKRADYVLGDDGEWHEAGKVDRTKGGAIANEDGVPIKVWNGTEEQRTKAIGLAAAMADPNTSDAEFETLSKEFQGLVSGITQGQGEIIQRSDGTPYKSEAAAKKALTAKGVDQTHEIAPVDGGFVLKPVAARVDEREETVTEGLNVGDKFTFDGMEHEFFDFESGKISIADTETDSVTVFDNVADFEQATGQKIAGVSVQAPVVERRDTELRNKRATDMTHDELKRVLLQNETTGAPNRRAYMEATEFGANPAPVQVSVDVDSLAWINDNMGHGTGDLLLQEVSKALTANIEQAFHISGDEFVAQGNDVAAMLESLQKAEADLKEKTLEIMLSNGKTITKKGIDITYGISETGSLTEADERLQQNKAAREAAGIRAGRKEQPKGVTIQDPARSNDQVSEDQGLDQQADSGTKAKPKSPKQVAAEKRRTKVDPAKDDILMAISKLGGIQFEQARSEWGSNLVDDTETLGKRGVFGKPIFHKTKGMPIDRMREALVEAGYLKSEDSTIEDLYQAIDSARRGEQVLSQQGEYDTDAMEQAYYETLEKEENADIDLLNDLLAEVNEANYEQAKQEALDRFSEQLSEESQQAAAEEAGRDDQSSTDDSPKGNPDREGTGQRVEKTDAGDQVVGIEGDTTPIEFGAKKPPAGARDVSTGDLMADMSGLEPSLFDPPQKQAAAGPVKHNEIVTEVESNRDDGKLERYRYDGKEGDTLHFQLIGVYSNSFTRESAESAQKRFGRTFEDVPFNRVNKKFGHQEGGDAAAAQWDKDQADKKAQEEAAEEAKNRATIELTDAQRRGLAHLLNGESVFDTDMRKADIKEKHFTIGDSTLTFEKRHMDGVISFLQDLVKDKVTANPVRRNVERITQKMIEAKAGVQEVPVSSAPEYQYEGVDGRELSEIVDEFNSYSEAADADQQHHLFDAPKKNEIVRLNDKTKVYHAEHGWMTPEQARQKIDEWEAHAVAQGKDSNAGKNDNSKKIVLSLFDMSGEWSRPWEQAGYQVFRFDIQNMEMNTHAGEVVNVGDVHNFSTDFFNDIFASFDGLDIHAVLAACPCTDFAVSGARHFAVKDADGRTIKSVALVHQTLATIEHFKPTTWAVENPVGRIEKLGGLPPWRLSFDPNHVGDPYTKKTLIWGRFNADLPIAPVEPTEGSKMHKLYGGKSQATKNARSVTPEGFSYAFFMANNAIDHPAMTVANKYDRLNADLIGKAIDAGITPAEIDAIVEEYYYQELDDAAAERDLAAAIEAKTETKADYSRLPVEVSDQIKRDAELNPKVSELVYQLNEAGYKTTLSGDGYGSGFVYVDLDKSVVTDITAANLPEGWVLTWQDMPLTKRDVLGISPSSLNEKDIQARESGPRVRIAKKDTGPVSAKEASAVVDSIKGAKADPPSVETVTAPEQSEASPLQKLYDKLEKTGSVRVGDIDIKVVGTADGYVMSKIEDGVRIEEGGDYREGGLSLDEARQIARKEIERAHRRLESKAKAEPAKPKYGEDNKVFTKKDADAALAILMDMDTLGSNRLLDPKLAQAGITLAGYHIEAGARKFGDFAVAMRDALGQKFDLFKPYLKSWYVAVKADPATADWKMDGFDAAMNADLDYIIFKADQVAKAQESDILESGQPQEAPDGDRIDQASEGESVRGVGIEPAGKGNRSPDAVGSKGTQGAVEGERASSPDAKSGTKSAQPDQRADGGRVPAPRSGRSGTAGVHSDGAGSRSDSPDRGGPKLEPQQIPGTNYRTPADFAIKSGDVAKYNDNVAAIRTLKTLQTEKRNATAAEQQALAQYIGWGGLANAFRKPDGTMAKGWEARVAEVEELLTKDELDTARNSTQFAHYTSKEVVDSVWNIVSRLGFKQGNILEPAIGTGNFIGMAPDNIAVGGKFTGVEYDPITAGITAALYPQSHIVKSGFEKIPIPNGYFDLVVGNPPFSKTSLAFKYQPQLNRYSMHNQFMMAGIEALKPGGVQVFVVSRYFLDAKDASARTAIAEKADLIAAYRLPDTAFKSNAGTEVITDIIVLKKKSGMQEDGASREFGAVSQGSPWLAVGAIEDPLGGKPIDINAYFVNNPTHIIGTLDRSGSQNIHSDINVSLKPGQTIAGTLTPLISNLPADIIETGTGPERATQAMNDLKASINIALRGGEVGRVTRNAKGELVLIYEKEGGAGDLLAERVINAESPWNNALQQDQEGKWFEVVDEVDGNGKPVKQVVNGRTTTRNKKIRKIYGSTDLVPSTRRLGDKGFERLSDAIDVLDTLVEQINMETGTEANAATIEKNRKKLKRQYDEFVKKHDHMNSAVISKLIDDLPNGALLRSLEAKYEAPVTAQKAKSSGKKVRPAIVKPSDILTQRIIYPYESPTKADNAQDAMAISMSETGAVDIARIADLTGKSEADIIKELHGDKDSPLIFNDPETGKWEVASEYLGGNVVRKLEAARQQGLEKNVTSLQKVQPEPWSADKVTVTAGATWVPTSVYADFVQHLTGRKGRVAFSRLTNTFAVEGNSTTALQWNTPGRDALGILGNILNSQAIRITTTVGYGKDRTTIVDQEATQAANDMAEAMKEEFADWAFRDSARRTLLVDMFNQKFNVRVNKQRDGSHLKFPGKVPDHIIKLRRHQINAVWRGIIDRIVLYDHTVGSGKTFTAISRAMERRRMGLSRKPMMVVPNHIIDQVAKDAYSLYPGAKILAAGAKDLSRANRRRLFARIATGDWDLVIVPHSSFQFIGISPETETAYLQQELRDAMQAVIDAQREHDESGDGGRFKPLTVKEAERLVQTIEARLSKIRDKDRDKDMLLTFEQMGIDDLTVDESHEFKNLFYNSRLNVRGMNPKAGSGKAYDIWTKTRLLRESGGAMAFMTGTPVSNSAVELYGIMRYLVPDQLAEMGLEHFDSWRVQFSTVTTAFEPTETGRGLKEVNRIGRDWSNMRSLMDLYYSFADAVSNDDIKKWYAEDNPGQQFPIPNVKGGGRQAVNVNPTSFQEAIIDEIVAGFAGLPGMPFKERNAERLRLMDRARKVSLDARAVDSNSADTGEGGKLEKIAENVKRLYDAHQKDKGTQLIFLDRSVPKTKGDEKMLRDYDKLVEQAERAEANGTEEEIRALNERLEKYDSNEMSEIRAAQLSSWNAYDELKKRLTALGIQEKEIRFVGDANTDDQKRLLFEEVNNGNVRVVIGSTKKMGAGTNVQERLVGVHHGDVTWKPSDIEQREGRIIRQGNSLYAKYGDGFQVEILAYTTERTVDAKLWSLNATKLKMINGLRQYNGDFNMEFDDSDSVGMAEIAAIASGEPLQLERVKLSSEIDKLTRQKSGHRRRMWGVQDDLQRARDAIAAVKDIPQMEKEAQAWQQVSEKAATRRVTLKVGATEARFGLDAATEAKTEVTSWDDAHARKGTKEDFFVHVDGKKYTSKTAAHDAIQKALGDVNVIEAQLDGTTYISRSALDKAISAKITAELEANGVAGEMEERKVATVSIGGLAFDLSVQATAEGNGNVEIDLFQTRGERSYRIGNGKGKANLLGYADIVNNAVTGTASDLMRTVKDMPDRAEKAKKDAATAKEFLPQLEEMTKEQFPKEAELAQKEQRLQEVQAELAANSEKADPQQNPDPTFSRAAEASIASMRESIDAFEQTAPEQGTADELEFLRRSISDYLGIKLPRGAYVPGNMPSHPALVRLGTAFGQTIIPFRSKSKEGGYFDGVTLPGKSKHIFLNEKASKPALTLFGHELVHQLRRNHPDLYDALLTVANKQLTAANVMKYKAIFDKQRAAEGHGESKYDAAVEELLADFVGDQATDPSFWRQVAGYNPSVFGRIVDAVNGLIDRVLKAMKVRGLGSSKYFTELESVKDAAAKVLAEYADRVQKKAPTKVDKTGDPMYSLNPGNDPAILERMKGNLYVPERLSETAQQEVGRDSREAAAEAVASGSLRAVRQVNEISKSNWPEGEYRQIANQLLRPAEAQDIKAWAEKNGLMLDNKQFNTAWEKDGKRGGTEHDVYRNAADGRWYKRQRFTMTDTFTDYFQRIILTNRLNRGATHGIGQYRLEGFVENNGELQPVVSQADIVADMNEPTIEEINALMDKAGFERADKGGPDFMGQFRIPGENHIISDHYKGNVARVDGQIIFLDPLIKPDIDSKRDRVDAEVLADKYGMGPLFNRPAEENWYFSAATRAAENMKQSSLPAKSWVNALLKMPNVKQAELDWTGVAEWLNTKTGNVTKGEVVQFLERGGVQVQEVVKGEGKPPVVTARRAGDMQADGTAPVWATGVSVSKDMWVVIRDGEPVFLEDSTSTEQEAIGNYDQSNDDYFEGGSDDTRFTNHTLHGGTNQREIMLTLPLDRAQGIYTVPEPHQYNDGKSDDNRIAHIRLNDRYINGEKVLFIEEIQSDWNLAGRKEGFQISELRFKQQGDKNYLVVDQTGRDVAVVNEQTYSGPWTAEALDREKNRLYETLKKDPDKVPQAPFVMDSDWQALALKRIMRLAAEEGYARVAWVTGEQTAQRYSLDDKIDHISYEPVYNEDTEQATGEYEVSTVDLDGKEIEKATGEFTLEEIEKILGKEIAQKIKDGEGKESGGAYREWKELRGDDLKIEATWARDLYDKAVPGWMKKFGKNLGATIDPITIESGVGGSKQSQQQSLPITEQMRTEVMDGLPLFSRRRPMERVDRIKSWAEQRTDYLQLKFQDRFIDLKQTQELLEKNGWNKVEDADAYLAEELSHEKAVVRIEKFQESHIKPLTDEIKRQKLDIADVELYLYARHAPERNAYIQEINAEFTEGGSGMTDGEAARIMDAFAAAGKTAKLERVAAKFDAVTKFQRDTIRAAGLETAETMAAWSRYDYYAPLKGAPGDVVEGHGNRNVGRGLDVRRSGTKQALGRRSEARDLIGNTVAQAMDTVIRAEKSKIGNAFLKMVEQNPDPTLWKRYTKETLPTRSVLAKNASHTRIKNRIVKLTDDLASAQTTADIQQIQQDLQDARADLRVTPARQVMEVPDTNVMVAPNVLAVTRRGIVNYIEIQNEDLARNMKNLNPASTSKMVQVMGRVTRVLAMVNTSLNPEFVITNFERDIQTALINISGEHGAKLAARVLKGVPAAMKGIRHNLRSTKAPTDMAKWYDRFREAGGKVGYLDLVGVEEIQKRITADIESYHKNPTAKIARDHFMKGLRFIEDYNVMVENAVRLSAFKVAIEAGVSESKAASLAKNLTVNFNRKGELGAGMNSAYMFFNAAVQGNMMIYNNLKNKGTRKVVMGIVAMAVAIAEMNRFAGGEDEDGVDWWDKQSDYTKEMNLIFPMDDGEIFKIKLPYGYNVFVSLGYAISDAGHYVASGGKRGKSPGAAMGFLLNSAVGAFNPMGGDASFLQFLAPTVVDPFVQMAENKNFWGGPIMPEPFPFGAPKPQSEMYFSSVRPVSKATAQWLNEVTGGSVYEPGKIDISPEILDHFWDFATGGMGRFYSDTAGAIAATAMGEPVETRRMPFKRHIVQDANTYYDRALYRDNRANVETQHKIVRDMRSMGNHEEAVQHLSKHPELRIRSLATKTDENLSKINKAKRTIEANEAMDKRQKRAIIEELEAKQLREVKQFNKIYRELTK